MHSITNDNGNIQLRFGNTIFVVNQFKGVTKEEFFKTYAPLGVEVEEAWQLIQEELKALEDVRKPEKKGK